MTTPNIEELRLLAQTLEFSDAVRCSIQRAADLLQSQAERIKELEAGLQMLAATEPVYYIGGGRLYGDKTSALFDNAKNAITELFTRPMPAQDVTELVEALEMIVSTHQGHCEHHVGVSKHSYNLADIAEEALSKYKGAKL